MNADKKIFIPCQKFIRRLSLNEIVWCKAERNYTVIILKDGTNVLFSKSLSQFEQIIDAKGFLRISQSYLVNVDFINLIHKQGKIIELENGEKISFTIKLKELVSLVQHAYPGSLTG